MGLQKWPQIPIIPPAQVAGESFYVCSRPVRGEGFERNTARQCNCEHVGIYGDNSGMIYDGWNGPGPITNRGLPTGPDVKCTKLRKVTTRMVSIPSPGPMAPIGPIGPIVEDLTLSWGPSEVKGKSCKDATAAEIRACLSAKPGYTGYPDFPGYLVTNCQTDVLDATLGCCLGGFRPWTVVPTVPIVVN